MSTVLLIAEKLYLPLIGCLVYTYARFLKRNIMSIGVAGYCNYCQYTTCNVYHLSHVYNMTCVHSTHVYGKPKSLGCFLHTCNRWEIFLAPSPALVANTVASTPPLMGGYFSSKAFIKSATASVLTSETVHPPKPPPVILDP